MEIERRIIEKNGKRYFFRLSERDRKHHNLMFLLMFVLFATGFPQMFYGEWWAPRVYRLVGGPVWAPTIHRFAGMALAGLFLLHILSIARDFAANRLPEMRRNRVTLDKFIYEVLALEMVPNVNDLREMLHHMRYLLYLKESPPEYGRMTWREKIDYLALYIGIPALALTGLLLWQGDILTRFIPGIFLNVSHIVHSYEATIILLSVVGFHWYNVHYSPDKFPMSQAFITGYIPEKEMAKEHYCEYVESMKEAGSVAQTRAIDDMQVGVLERFGYKLFTVINILFFVFFTTVAARYIFYSPPSTPLEKPPANGISPSGADKISGCILCHTDVPHTESNVVAEPFLNMHTSRIACEVCHMRGKEIAFKWYDPVSGTIAADPGGIGAKIISGQIEGGSFIPLKVDARNGDVRLNKKGHSDLSKEPLKCGDCHRKDGRYLPLAELGYSLERASRLNSPELLAVIDKYRKGMEER